MGGLIISLLQQQHCFSAFAFGSSVAAGIIRFCTVLVQPAIVSIQSASQYNFELLLFALPH